VEEAEGGTLFLDEVADCAPEVQPKLLRLLEAREYQRLGDRRERKADIRVIAATNRDLRAEVDHGRFRLDLYHRLAVVELRVPPLRERLDEIAPLARHFARQLSGIEVSLGAETIAAFQCASWPGNVRELRNAVERVLVLDSTEPFGSAGNRDQSFIEARDRAMKGFERDYLVSLLEGHGGNVSAAARAAKLARSHFYKLLERHNLVAKKS
jgi:DNA-binding NtrC family response regulator